MNGDVFLLVGECDAGAMARRLRFHHDLCGDSLLRFLVSRNVIEAQL